jgi:hypothetical protein
MKFCSFANGRHSDAMGAFYESKSEDKQTISLVCLNHQEMCCAKRGCLIDSTPTCEAFRGVDSGDKNECLSRVCFM